MPAMPAFASVAGKEWTVKSSTCEEAKTATLVPRTSNTAGEKAWSAFAPIPTTGI